MRNCVGVFILLVIFSCNREVSTWDVDILGPVVQTEFSISDLLPDSIVTSTDENLLVISTIVEIINLIPDTLIAIPDTLISNGYTLPPPLISLPISPGLPFPISSGDIELNTGNNIEIKEAVINTGSISVSIRNPLETELIVTYIIPSLTNNNLAFTFNDTLSQSNNGIPSITNSEFDISDFHLDMTGMSGFSHNEILQSISVINSSLGNAVTATNMDTILFDLQIN